MDSLQPTTVINTDGDEVINRSTARGEVISDGSNDRILIGYQKAGFGDKDLGIKVSQEGYDVKTATDAQLIMSSAFNMFKVVLEGRAIINVPSAANDFINSVVVDHNLGFVPGYIVFLIPPVGYSSAPKNAQLPWYNYLLFDSGSATPSWRIIGLADVSDLTDTEIDFRLSFIINSASKVGDWTFHYYLLQETAN